VVSGGLCTKPQVELQNTLASRSTSSSTASAKPRVRVKFSRPGHPPSRGHVPIERVRGSLHVRICTFVL
jgi:hypothetical protein